MLINSIIIMGKGHRLHSPSVIRESWTQQGNGHVWIHRIGRAKVVTLIEVGPNKTKNYASTSSSNRTYNLTCLRRLFKAVEQKRATHLNHLLDTIPETKSTATQIVEDLMDLMQQANFDLVLSEYKGVIFEQALA
jgi:hypothetical protein